MKTILPYPVKSYLFALGILFTSDICQAQNYKGKDGAGNYTTPGTYIVNRYTTLASSAGAGSLSVTVTNVGNLSGTISFTNSVNPFANATLSRGDLIMIIQVQGVDITTTDDAAYGAITAYNNTGNYEVRTVYDVTANTILLCQNLQHSYNQGGRARTQVIRIPRFSSLTIAAGVTLTGLAWNGTTGGIVALEAANNMTINGIVTSSDMGFRGGVDDKNTSSASGNPPLTLFRTADNSSASKGESIAGNNTDYNTYFNGANGRGAPANGGGGGNGHNTGGGGGANAATNGLLGPWNGTGIKDNTTPLWTSAWNLELASFASDISTGGGRGGYSYGSANQDALTLIPGSILWGGDYRHNVGGFGGRPLDNNNNTRIFMGGGGGAGEGNNNSAGNGGNGGGIVYLYAGMSMSGTGTVSADGQNGFDTQNSNKDAAGGAGGGGAIVAISATPITSITMTAKGGIGGNQLYIAGEAEGPGGGGGGGYIATTISSNSKSASGGHNGVSQSVLVTEFTPNGATIGNDGTISQISFTEIFACDPLGFILPIRFISFTAQLLNEDVKLNWITGGETTGSYFEIEKSIDGNNFIRISTMPVKTNPEDKSAYNHSDLSIKSNTMNYYRIKWINTDGKVAYSEVKVIQSVKQSDSHAITVYPNPVSKDLRITLPASWQGMKVRIDIYDVSGKLARSIEKSKVNQTEIIDMNNLVKGYYLMKASMGKETAHQKLIKN